MLRVLLMDDELTILEDLELMLGSDDRIQIVGAFHDPLELLKNLPALKADCLFMDIEMPGINGIELAAQIQAAGTDMEIIFVTAYNHYATQAFEVHAMDYLLKPIRPERLAKAIDRVIRQRESKQPPGREEKSCVIHSLGTFEIKVGASRVKWTRSKSRELMAYMLQHEGKWLSKYKLCDEQWRDYEPERALAYLQTSIYSLRKNLREAGCNGLLIEYSEDKYRLQAGEVEWDTRNFEAAYSRFIQTGSPVAAREALALYRGEYLEGEDWPWSDNVRESYICKYERIKQVV
ncbi:hypothetical protein A7K91_00635 [Paenibacillus oryzae]|uniref:Response regulatory domain-containing protein n=1 Tax=Paenibacillus oryzae TaxID=1844972 RepID=A0A1A5YII8_9BACL|nr:response regulator [Paenibacillus oryzae]OBR65215.1 hypothetical protein A7K91_00635 [Paenibacillus oryzae]